MKKEIMNCLTWYANRVAETVQYKNWPDDVCRKEIDESTNKLCNELKKYIDFHKLTREEATELRFGKWAEDDDLYLIPLYLLPIVPIGMELTNICGDKFIYNGSNVDNDTRFGCIAYGIHIPEGDNAKDIEKLNDELKRL